MCRGFPFFTLSHSPQLHSLSTPFSFYTFILSLNTNYYYKRESIARWLLQTSWAHKNIKTVYLIWFSLLPPHSDIGTHAQLTIKMAISSDPESNYPMAWSHQSLRLIFVFKVISWVYGWCCLIVFIWIEWWRRQLQQWRRRCNSCQ